MAASLAAGCAAGGHRPAANPLPPPARESRAGTRDPGAGPVSVQPAGEVPRLRPRTLPRDAAVARAVEAARSLAGRRDIVLDGVRYGDGCAALIRAAFEEAGRALPPSVRDAAALHQLARREGALRRTRPVPGDVVFLADRPGGPAEHVGLVERVGESGTATVLHRTGRGVVRLHLTAEQAAQGRAADGALLNDLLEAGGKRIPAGRLLVAFASLL